MPNLSRLLGFAKWMPVILGVLVAPAQAAYWSLFNIERESAQTAQYVTYGSLGDMLADTNRLGVFSPTGGGAGDNVVGSGSDDPAVGGGDVPEPATLALSVLAGALLFLVNRRARPQLPAKASSAPM